MRMAQHPADAQICRNEYFISTHIYARAGILTHNFLDLACLVVLIGSKTAGRKWVDYEIAKALNEGLGVVGVYIHRLKDLNSRQAFKGSNPFDGFTIGRAEKKMSSVVKAYDPGFFAISQGSYAYIKDNIARWVEEAIQIRRNF
jgi:hypothetical protein